MTTLSTKVWKWVNGAVVTLIDLSGIPFQPISFSGDQQSCIGFSANLDTFMFEIAHMNIATQEITPLGDLVNVESETSSDYEAISYSGNSILVNYVGDPDWKFLLFGELTPEGWVASNLEPEVTPSIFMRQGRLINLLHHGFSVYRYNDTDGNIPDIVLPDWDDSDLKEEPEMMIEERVIPTPNPEASYLSKEFIEYCNVTNRIVAGYTNKSIVVWDALTGDKLKTFSNHTAVPKGAKISPNGQKVVSFDANRIYVWDTVAGTSVTYVKSAGTVAWYSDEVFYYSTNNKLLAIDITTGSTVKDKTVDEHDHIRWMDTHPTEDKILLGDTHSITVVDLDGGLLTSIVDEYRYIKQLRWHPEGDKISFIRSLGDSNADGYSFVVLDIDTEEIVTEVIYHAGNSGDCVWSESGDKFMLCDSYMHNRIYNLSGEGICGVYTSRDSSTSCGAWVGNDSIICDSFFVTSSSNKGAMRIKNIDSTHKFDEHVGAVKEVLWSSDSTVSLSSGEDNTIKVWSKEGGAVASLSLNQGVIKDIAVANDSDRFAFLGEDNVINVWGNLGSSPVPRKFIQTDDVYTEMIWSGDNIVVTNGVELVVYDSETGNMLKDFTDSEIVELKSVNKKDLVSYKNGDSLITLNIDTEEKKEYEVSPEDFMYEFSLFGDSVVLFGNSEIEVREMTDFSLLFSSQDEVKRASWSSGGGFLTLVIDGGNLKIYDTENWSIYRSYSELDEEYDFVAMIDGGFLVAYGDPNEGLLLEGYSYEIGDGTEQNPFRVRNVEGFLGISRDRYSHYLLTNNLDIKGWEMLGPIQYDQVDSSYPGSFKGTLDGAFFEVKGIVKNGLFEYTGEGFVLKNITLEVNTDGPALFGGNFEGPFVIENCTIKGFARKGMICDYLGITGFVVKDCTFEGEVEGGAGMIGNTSTWGEVQPSLVQGCKFTGTVTNGQGLIGGRFDNSVIRDCEFIGTITNGSGIVKRCGSGTLVENCHVKANIESNSQAAGIVCEVYYPGVVIKDCTFEGEITSEDEVGGIIQYADKVRVENCRVFANLRSDGANCFGIAGNMYDSESLITDCTFEGEIIAGGRASGIAEFMNGRVSNCLVKGRIVSLTGEARGLVDHLATEGILENSAFIGEIEGIGEPDRNRSTCGLVGFCDEGGEIHDCFVIGDLEAEYALAGVVGPILNPNKLKNVYFKGTLEGSEVKGIGTRYDSIPEEVSWYYTPDVEDEYGIKVTEEQLKDETTFFPTWDFENIWVIDERVNDGFPMLRSLLRGELDPDPPKSSKKGVGYNAPGVYLEDNPYPPLRN